jgi:NAD-dependent dihydropyrimidine dehydrogenase PreA subunit
MTFVIAEPCVGVKDGSCANVCPVECIHTRPGEHQFFIDPAECIDCGVCVPECPVDAIVPEGEVPPRWEDFIGRNAGFFGADDGGLSGAPVPRRGPSPTRPGEAALPVPSEEDDGSDNLA